MKKGEVKIAYIIPGPKEYLTLHVRYSANAWWMDSTKLFRLVDAFDHSYASIREACVFADITKRQFKYFAKCHPLIHQRRLFPHNILSLRAKAARAALIEAGNLKTTYRYLIKKEPESYSLYYKGSPDDPEIVSKLQGDLSAYQSLLTKREQPPSQ